MGDIEKQNVAFFGSQGGSLFIKIVWSYNVVFFRMVGRSMLKLLGAMSRLIYNV